MIRGAAKVIPNQTTKVTGRRLRGQATIAGLFAKSTQDPEILEPSSAEVGPPPSATIVAGAL